MRKIIWLIILIIILVSLNWFQEALAADSDTLAKDRGAALRELQLEPSAVNSNRFYRSQSFFEQPEQDSLELNRLLPDDSDSVEQKAFPHRIADSLLEFEALTPFGLELFEQSNQVNTPIDIPTDFDYVLGPGDNVIIYLWGRVEKEYNLTIDREGRLFIPEVGELIAWGLSLEQLRQKAATKFGTVYSEFELTVSLGKIRSIRVFVAGEVRRPGAYTVSSLTSLFNALCIAGGPSEQGSLRRIRLMRSGALHTEVDLYRLLLAGENTGDVRLQTGDVIFVPVAAGQVAIRGEVKRSAWYELLGSETAADLLALAGGPTAQAHLERVMLERISDEEKWTVVDVNLTTGSDDSSSVMVLRDGDRLTVASIFAAKENLVAVHGQVKHPGYYERTDSTCVSSLLTRAGLQDYDVYYDRADLFRRHEDRRTELIRLDLRAVLSGDTNADIRLRDRDSIHVYAIGDVVREEYVYIEGEVNSPGPFPLYDRMTVEDLIFLAGSFTRSASRAKAELARVDDGGELTTIFLDLNDPSHRSMPLRKDDQMFVRQLPDWQDNRLVQIDGQVQYPGAYALSADKESLWGLIQRAGGFTEEAFPRGIIVERTSINESLQRRRVATIIENSIPIVEDSTGKITKESLVDFDANQLNRLIIDVDRLVASNGAEGDVVLEPNDRVFVPTIPSGISVIGAVGSNGTIRYLEKQNVSYYIRRAGSFTRRADKGETRLIRASGAVVSNNIMSQRVELGDIIIVPTKIEREHNTLKTITTALGAATGVLTTFFLIDKL